MNHLAILAMMPLPFVCWMILLYRLDKEMGFAFTALISFAYTCYTVLFIWGIANL
jgi:hypothetical protein